MLSPLAASNHQAAQICTLCREQNELCTTAASAAAAHLMSRHRHTGFSSAGTGGPDMSIAVLMRMAVPAHRLADTRAPDSRLQTRRSHGGPAACGRAGGPLGAALLCRSAVLSNF